MATSNKVEMTFTADDKDLIASYQKQYAAQEKQYQALEKMFEKSKSLSHKQQQALLKQIELQELQIHKLKEGGEVESRVSSKWHSHLRLHLGDLTKVVAATGAIAAGYRVMSDAFQHYQKVREEAGQKNMESVSGMSQLAQLAAERGNPRKALANLTKQAQTVFAQGVGESEDEAARFVFAMESAGVRGQDWAILQQLAGRKAVGDAVGFVESLKGLQVAVGQRETGSLRDIASKAFSASSFAAAPADQLLAASAVAGPGAAALKMRDEELLAAIAITSNATNASQAGTQMKAMIQSLQNQGGFTGVPLREIVNQIDSRGMDDAQLNKFFGSSEAAMAFRLLRQNIGDYSSALSKIDTAAQRDVAATVAQLPATNPITAGALLNQQAQARLAVSRSNQGIVNNLANSMHAELVRAAENGYGSSYFENTMAYTGRFFRGDMAMLQEPRNQRILQENNPELLIQILTTLKEMKQQNEQQIHQGKEQINEQKQQRNQRIPRRGE